MSCKSIAWGNEKVGGAKITASARLCLLGLVLVALAATPLLAGDWTMFGYDTTNAASNGSSINTSNVNTLKPRFVVTTGGDISARAAVAGGKAFFPDWAGNIWAVNSNNGQLIWVHQLSDYGLPVGTVSRTSPAVIGGGGGTVFIGTQYNANYPNSPSGWILALNANTGALVWKVRPDTSNIFPAITSSPSISGNTIYVGMTSNEEYAASDPTYPCCSVVGSVVALNANNGAKLWQTFMAPAGYSGANVWGSTPVIDTARKMVYVGTGNNYSIPTDPAYTSCIAGGGTEATCLSPNDHADSVVALDMNTGAIKWATRAMQWNQYYEPTNGSDFWNTACIFPPFTNCPPSPTGPDYDFGSGPNEITYQPAHGPAQTIIGAGQKSGIYYAFNPDTGALLWSTQVGPGSSLGGMEWGSASDGTRIYVAISNLYGIPYAAGSAGSWAALNPATGAILWQKADPNGAVDLGPLAVANGVLYAPSMGGPTFGGGSPGTAPTMFGLDAATGNTLWSFAAGSSVIAGATVENNNVWWGSGYAHLGIPGFTGNNKFYGFTPNGN